MNLEVIVLAAGKGARMRSDLPKVLNPLAGQPLLQHVLSTVSLLGPKRTHVVYGYGGDAVRQQVQANGVNWVHQSEQLGTGHAVSQAMVDVDSSAKVLVVYGDIPLIGADTLQGLVDQTTGDHLAILTASFDDPSGYGRIVRDAAGRVVKIVEHRDADAETLKLREVNTGFMAATAAQFSNWLGRLNNDNSQCEYYLTQVIGLAVDDDISIVTHHAQDVDEVLGVNSHAELARVERLYQRRRAHQFMEQGVCIRDPDRFDARGDVSIGCDCIIDVNVVLEGPLEIGDRVCIGPHCVISGSRIDNDVDIRSHSVIDQAHIGSNVLVGPFARIRPGADIASGVHIGNFVEIKNSTIDEGSKVNHLAYVGDSTVGRNTNIGAGVITCNYDGAKKNRTEIGDDVFVGSNAQLVAPVRLGKGATVGAGSTITTDVPEDTLAVTRARQRLIPGWKRPKKKK